MAQVLSRRGRRTIGLVFAVNLIGATPAALVGSETDWIDRPSLYPPEIAFPIAWTLLFTLAGIALSIVWEHGLDRRDVRLALVAFGVQFALNLAWTPVFFGLRRPGLGLAVIGGLWVAIVVTIAAFDRVDRRAAVLLVPYLIWVSFAAVLNHAIHAA
jgi:tryptophan-rich sensory protein